MSREAMQGLLQQWLISVAQNERENLASFTREAVMKSVAQCFGTLHSKFNLDSRFTVKDNLTKTWLNLLIRMFISETAPSRAPKL